MDAPTLESAWLKWNWAARQGKRLQAEIDGALKADGGSVPALGIGYEYDPKLKAWIVRVASLGPVPIRFSLMTGDIVQNYRSALDHLAWFLVHRGTKALALTDPERKRIYFPIYDKREAFDSALAQKLPGIRDNDLDIVRALQPYQADERDRARHTLRVIANLSDHDKHRTLQPIGLRLASVTCNIVRARGCVVRRVVPSTRTDIMKINTKLATIFGHSTSRNFDFQVDVEVSADVAFDESLWVKNFLQEAQIHVCRALLAFGPPPSDLDARVGDNA